MQRGASRPLRMSCVLLRGAPSSSFTDLPPISLYRPPYRPHLNRGIHRNLNRHKSSITIEKRGGEGGRGTPPSLPPSEHRAHPFPEGRRDPRGTEGRKAGGHVSPTGPIRSPNSILDTFSFLSGNFWHFWTFDRRTGEERRGERSIGSWQAYPCQMGYMDRWIDGGREAKVEEKEKKEVARRGDHPKRGRREAAALSPILGPRWPRVTRVGVGGGQKDIRISHSEYQAHATHVCVERS